ncbi:thioredoxin family protein [Amygdalobacter nucleatus]|uniref:Thioredoxin n=1 Tax=Amygdalobacter nucleatus TaxID=3029274 RepID=A0A133YCM1_9FIRM|nr:thioredoxin family protein [Amygdalobacter nucleatus]KXB40911.1 thioredoxin [Amygdalobacter nucleatus]MDF0485381.1 thioredoxin family protein [Amygdalobacter nucleatus]WEG36756.1 thioredoxin family protein [Amygdalobacter nucleatus]
MRHKIVNSKQDKHSKLFWSGFAVIFLIAATFLITLLILPADLYNDKAETAAIETALREDVGSKVTSGDNLLLLACYKKKSDTIELTYRKLNDLAHFVHTAKRPVLMAVREQTNKFANPIINPYLEDLAEKYYKQIYVVLVEPDQATEFMRKLEFKYIPTFYLWEKGEIKAEVNGFKDEALAEFTEKVEAILK